jgi:tripeptidyl-peptidase-1
MYALLLAPFLFTLALADRHHWKRTSAAIDRTERMHFSIGLKQQNLELLDPELMAVSTPHSPRFGQHYSAQDVATLFAASNTTISTVMDWMMAGGIDSERITVRPGKIWLDAHASLAEIEGLLSTRYSMYEHDTGYKTLGTACFR